MGTTSFDSQVIIIHQLTFLPVNETIPDSYDKVSDFTSGFAIVLSMGDDPGIEWVDHALTWVLR